jgi:hypothetical protein
MKASEVARNGFIGGAASALGLAAMGLTIANPLGAAIIATSAVAYACLNSENAREGVVGGASVAYQGAADSLTTSSTPVFSISTVVGGAVATLVTGNPVFLYAGTAIGLGSHVISIAEIARK